jgi:hypothetical protein
MTKDYYSILNISNNSTKEEIIKSFRELAKKYHPDKNSSPNASDKFREIFEAYEILKNDEKRKVYDQYWNAKYKRKEEKPQTDFEPEFKEQREYAKQTADKYSKMPYEDFINSALFNIQFVVRKTPTIGGIILVFLVGLMFLIFMGFLFSSNIDGGIGALVGLFMLSIAGAFFYVAIKDWNKLMEERKRQQREKHYR